MERRRFEAEGKGYGELRRGWMPGGEEFRKKLLEQAGQWLGPNHFGRERRETAEARAQRIVSGALQKAGLSQGELPLLPANSGIKVELARRLRRETTMGLKWIAGALAVGSWKYFSNLLKAEPRNRSQRELNL